MSIQSPFDTELSPAPAGSFETISGGHQAQRKLSNAKRHSLLVKILRWALPLAAIALTLFFAATVFLSFVPITDVTIDSASIEEGKLVMNAPVLSGFDSKKRAYDVKAGKAVQQLSRPGVVELEEIAATLPIDAKSSAKVLATAGTYDTKKETLYLRDDISIVGARGMDILLQDAQINMKAGSMSSQSKVIVKFDQTIINAGSISIERNGDRVLFANGVETTIQPNALYSDSDQ